MPKGPSPYLALGNVNAAHAAPQELTTLVSSQRRAFAIAACVLQGSCVSEEEEASR